MKAHFPLGTGPRTMEHPGANETIEHLCAKQIGLALGHAIDCRWGCNSGAGADWPQFMGPNGDGTTAEKGLLRAWPADGPKVLWTCDGSGLWRRGHSRREGLCAGPGGP